MTLEPKLGAIARCSAGEKGLITSSGQVEVTYEDGNKGLAWTGFHISPDRIGQPWSSRQPFVVQYTSPKTRQVLEYLIGRARRQKRLE